MGRPEFGSRFKALREKVRLPQDVVARALEIPRSAVSAFELGERDISASELILLCRIYRVSPNEILGWAEEPPTAAPEEPATKGEVEGGD